MRYRRTETVYLRLMCNRVPNFSIYCASKWAVEGFTEAISQEVKPDVSTLSERSLFAKSFFPQVDFSLRHKGYQTKADADVV